MSSAAQPESRDDREEFLARQHEIARVMASDAAVRELDLELMSASDRHDYSYMWRFLGVPIIQMPTDIVLMQELIWENRPQVIVETGLARGGSAILHSAMLSLLGEGRVIAVEIDIRDHNRDTVEGHPLGHRVTLVEGSSTDPAIVDRVRKEIQGVERVMVLLDSDHSHDHVLAELRMYGPMVTPGQFLVAADTLVEELPPQTHRLRPWGRGNNPKTAVDAYLAENDDFTVDPFVNDRLLLSSNRGGYLRRR